MYKIILDTCTQITKKNLNCSIADCVAVAALVVELWTLRHIIQQLLLKIVVEPIMTYDTFA